MNLVYAGGGVNDLGNFNVFLGIEVLHVSEKYGTLYGSIARLVEVSYVSQVP